jgi:hypothetical protein
MKAAILLSSLVLISSYLCAQDRKYNIRYSVPIKIKWVDALSGNFKFSKKWSYADAVYKNKFGQLSCDGDCPEEIERMFDNNRKILKDSLNAFYKLVDTSHYFHTISSDAWCYEWTGTDYIDVIKLSADSVYCYTLANAGTHCSLELHINRDTCYAVIYLNSIVGPHTDPNGVVWGGRSWFYSTGGHITIDRALWEKGHMKAEFSFNFEHKTDPKQPVYWKGKIFSRMQKPIPNKMPRPGRVLTQ